MTALRTVAFFLRTQVNGGIEPHLMLLGRGLMAAGFQIVLVSDGESRVPEYSFERYLCGRLHLPQGDVPRTESQPAGGQPGHFQRVAGQLSGTERPPGPDPRALSNDQRLCAGDAAAARGIVRVHASPHRHPKFGIPPIPIVLGRAGDHAQPEGRDFLIRAFGIDENRIRLVPHGTDEQHFRPPSARERRDARAKFGLAPDDKVVGMIGRMDSVKGQDVLLRALVDLRARGRVAIALLAGLSLSGSMEWGDKMREYAKRAGIAGQVQFLGYTDSRDVLWASDVCGPAEPSGRIRGGDHRGHALWGRAHPDAGGGRAAEQIDDGTNGFIVPFEDSAALAERLYTLLSDPDCRSRMSTATLEKGRTQFCAKVMVDRTIDVYKEVLQRPAALGARFTPARRGRAPWSAVMPDRSGSCT